MTASASLVRSVDGPVATLTVAREARRNALDHATWQALPGVLAAIADDPRVRVLVVRGAGTQAFSAGADLDELATLAGDARAGAAYLEAVEAALEALATLPQPTIAMIGGHCIGGGVDLALACDLRVASDDARVAVTPGRVGLVYGLSATRRLVAQVGPAVARWLLYTGEAVDAERALQVGFLNEVVPACRLEAVTYERAATIAARSTTTLRAAKRFVARVQAGAGDEDEASLRERDGAFVGADFAEGVAAFRAKRPPEFE